MWVYEMCDISHFSGVTDFLTMEAKDENLYTDSAFRLIISQV